MGMSSFGHLPSSSNVRNGRKQDRREAAQRNVQMKDERVVIESPMRLRK